MAEMRTGDDRLERMERMVVQMSERLGAISEYLFGIEDRIAARLAARLGSASSPIESPVADLEARAGIEPE